MRGAGIEDEDEEFNDDIETKSDADSPQLSNYEVRSVCIFI